MGVVSGAVVEAGGQVTGVIPYAMVAAGGEKEQADGEVKAKIASGVDRKSTRLNSSHSGESRMPSSA